VLELTIAASPSGDPVSGTFGNDAALAAVWFSDCDSTLVHEVATNVLVQMQVDDGTTLTGTAHLELVDGMVDVTFTAPMCDARTPSNGGCVTLPTCDATSTTPCMMWP